MTPIFKRTIIGAVILALSHGITAQVLFTRSGQISLFSHTDMEDIKAENNEAVSFLDASKGEFRFQVLIKGFQFPKAAMQQHFNQPGYMDSDKFPKSEFKGMIINNGAVNYKSDGNYKVEVEGELTMHGITKKIKVPGSITVKSGKISARANFNVKRTDFDIKVPSFNAAKIAELIDITVSCQYEPYQTQ